MPQIVIDLTAPQAQRLSVSFGKMFNLVDGNNAPRDANIQDLETFVKREFRKIVVIQEKEVAIKAVPDPTFDLV